MVFYGCVKYILPKIDGGIDASDDGDGGDGGGVRWMIRLGEEGAM